MGVNGHTPEGFARRWNGKRLQVQNTRFVDGLLFPLLHVVHSSTAPSKAASLEHLTKINSDAGKEQGKIAKFLYEGMDIQRDQ